MGQGYLMQQVGWRGGAGQVGPMRPKRALALVTRLLLLRLVSQAAAMLVTSPVFKRRGPGLRKPIARCRPMACLRLDPRFKLLHRRHIKAGRWRHHRARHAAQAVLGQCIVRAAGRQLQQPAQPVGWQPRAVQSLQGFPVEALALRIGLHQAKTQGHQSLDA